MQISRGELEGLVEARFIERGADYAGRGHVVFDDVSPDEVTAWVEGARVHRTALWRDGGSLAFRCTCPAFADWGSCKHVAAVALALPDQRAGRYQPDADSAQRVDDLAQVFAELADLSREDLVDLTLAASEDEGTILDAMASLAPSRTP